MQLLSYLNGGQVMGHDGCYLGTPAAAGTASIVYGLWD
jgi:hypothetical protein